MPEILIGRGKAARVYKVDRTPYALVRKEFSPICHVKLWNWFFYHSLHPLATEAGYKHAYWKRRLAHRLCKYLDCNVQIPDALQLSPKGFILRYVDGRPSARSNKCILYNATKKLETFFDSIGMPTWSFSRKNPFSTSNFVLHDDMIYIIDYEQSVPVPDSRRNIGYDTIYFADVHRFIIDNRQQILDRLGGDEMQYLAEAFVLAKEYHAQLDIKPKTITKLLNNKGKKIRRFIPEVVSPHL